MLHSGLESPGVPQDVAEASFTLQRLNQQPVQPGQQSSRASPTQSILQEAYQKRAQDSSAQAIPTDSPSGTPSHEQQPQTSQGKPTQLQEQQLLQPPSAFSPATHLSAQRAALTLQRRATLMPSDFTPEHFQQYYQQQQQQHLQQQQQQLLGRPLAAQVQPATSVQLSPVVDSAALFPHSNTLGQAAAFLNTAAAGQSPFDFSQHREQQQHAQQQQLYRQQQQQQHFAAAGPQAYPSLGLYGGASFPLSMPSPTGDQFSAITADILTRHAAHAQAQAQASVAAAAAAAAAAASPSSIGSFSAIPGSTLPVSTSSVMTVPSEVLAPGTQQAGMMAAGLTDINDVAPRSVAGSPVNFAGSEKSSSIPPYRRASMRDQAPLHLFKASNMDQMEWLLRENVQSTQSQQSSGGQDPDVAAAAAQAAASNSPHHKPADLSKLRIRILIPSIPMQSGISSCPCTTNGMWQHVQVRLCMQSASCQVRHLQPEIAKRNSRRCLRSTNSKIPNGRILSRCCRPRSRARRG